MFRKVFTLFVVVLIPMISMAQGSRERSAWKDLTKQRWIKAYSALQKSLSKDTANVPAFYLLGIYYFTPENPAFQLDSAYRYVKQAITIWNRGDERSRTRWSRLPLDSTDLFVLRDEIDSAAFQRAKGENSVQSYTKFIEDHSEAVQYQTAINLRYGVAFNAAITANTVSAIDAFVNMYPEAPQIEAAKSKYHELYYLEATRDQRLESFEAFVKANPNSPYRDAAEQSIFVLLTASGESKDFFTFLENYPKTKYKKLATDILYHLLKERGELLPPNLVTDSIASLQSLEKDYLVPILVKDKYGFINSAGTVVFAPEFTEINDDYVCGDITEDVIVVQKKMVTRKGAVILNGAVSEIEDIGFGFLKVTIDSMRTVLIHKSGYQVGDFSIDDAKVLNGRVLALKYDGRWGVFTLSGKNLLPLNYDNIDNYRNVLVLRQNGKITLSTIDTVAAGLNGGQHFFIAELDSVRKLGDQIWVKKDSLEGAYDDFLKSFIPLDTQTITNAFFGAVIHKRDQHVTVNRYGEASESFRSLKVQEPWVAAKTNEGWLLYSPEERISKSIAYDTLILQGPFAIGRKKDVVEVTLHKKPSKLITLSPADRIELLPGKDSISYLMVTKGQKTAVFDGNGNNLFTVAYDKIETAGSGYFIVSKRDKKGLVDPKGKLVLPVIYDAIGTAGNGMISVLKSSKFGIYDIEQKKLIAPEYEKNVIRFDKNTFVCFKNGAYGFVDQKNKPIGNFVFEEVQHWNDSVALVKQGGQYQLYDYYKRTPLTTGIIELKPILDGDEKLYIINKEGQFGVIHNHKGVIIPIKFSDIVNVGSKEKPLYFTEKHVQEASIFVVIYYNSEGKMLRKEVYEQDGYDQIYCDKK